MDPRLLRYYNRELQHVREMGAEFARDGEIAAGMAETDGGGEVERALCAFAPGLRFRLPCAEVFGKKVPRKRVDLGREPSVRRVPASGDQMQLGPR